MYSKIAFLLLMFFSTLIHAERLDLKLPHLANNDIDIISYNISLKLNSFERQDITANAKIYLKHLKYESFLDLHVEDTALEIMNVRDKFGWKYDFTIIKGIAGKPRNAMESFETGKKDGIVVLSGHVLRIKIPFFERFPQRRYFNIDYKIKADSLKHDRGLMLTDWYSLKQFNMRAWPYFTRYVAPANDHPNDTAKVKFNITVPNGMIVGANGVQLAPKKDGDFTTYIWKQNQPIPTYGMHFAAGNFETYTRDICYNTELSEISEVSCSDDTEKIPLLYHHPETIIVPDGTDFVPLFIEKVEASVKSFIFFSKFLGPYEYDKLGFVTTEYPFSMETASYMTLRSPSVAVHEVAHNWWGNVVYFKHWGDFWISEGITTYFTGLFDEYMTGTNTTDFLTQGTPEGKLRNPSDTDPLDIFDNVPYQRGAAAIHDLRSRMASLAQLELMGSDKVDLELFLRLMQELYTSYRLKLLDTDSLVAFFNERLPSFLAENGYQVSEEEIAMSISEWEQNWF